MSTELADLGVRATAAAVRNGTTSARERVAAALARIEERDSSLGAFLSVDPARALERASALDADARRARAPLAGVPVALKDNLCLEGSVTSAGSRMLAEWTAPYTATAVSRLLEAGAIPVGKTNLDEFAMGSSTENSALQPTLNPHDPERVPGGSSGGSAAAVAAAMVPGALGSDTGGSVRQPAAFCGVVGLKPTYGRVSRYGLVAFASSLDQIGPFARDVDDLAALLSAISGPDSCDTTCLDEPATPPGPIEPADPRALRVGLLEDWMGDGLEPAVRDAVSGAVERLAAEGASVEPVRLPHQEYAIATYYVVATAEASSNLGRYDGVRYGRRAADAATLDELICRSRSEGFGEEVKRRILLGTWVLSAGHHEAYYGRAQRVRTLLRRDFSDAFAKFDLLVGPTTPTTAFRRGENVRDPLAMYMSDVYTVTANLAGLPALSLPCGVDRDGLPVGLQLLGPPLAEEPLLRAARLVEQQRG